MHNTCGYTCSLQPYPIQQKSAARITDNFCYIGCAAFMYDAIDYIIYIFFCQVFHSFFLSRILFGLLNNWYIIKTIYKNKVCTVMHKRTKLFPI